MQSSWRPPRMPSRLPESLYRGINSYALAASAAGVSLLALAQSSEGKIIYTKTHHVIRTNGIYPLDLNRDGTIDFLIEEPYSLRVQSAFGNAAEGPSNSHSLFASALLKGAPINRRQHFASNRGSFGEGMVVFPCTTTPCSTVSGPWVNVNNRYLGLKFQIDGNTHYGWARLSVKVQESQITVTLTGYAYETTSDKGIHAGQTHDAVNDATTDPDSVGQETPEPVADKVGRDTVQPATLGRLARGFQLWRRPLP